MCMQQSSRLEIVTDVWTDQLIDIDRELNGRDAWRRSQHETAKHSAHLLQEPLRDYGINIDYVKIQRRYSLVDIPAHHIGFFRYV